MLVNSASSSNPLRQTRREELGYLITEKNHCLTCSNEQVCAWNGLSLESLSLVLWV
jgi:hypothetical protein